LIETNRKEFKMKIFTASYWEPEVHGPGRKIGISPSKPKNLVEEAGYDCNICHEFLSPEDAYWNYFKAKKAAGDNEELQKKASDTFVTEYQARLDAFKKAIQEESKAKGKSIEELMGLEEGDTLLSWERGGHITFRVHTAKCLRELGYEVEER
jgi:hypothetical protein